MSDRKLPPGYRGSPATAAQQRAAHATRCCDWHYGDSGGAGDFEEPCRNPIRPGGPFGWRAAGSLTLESADAVSKRVAAKLIHGDGPWFFEQLACSKLIDARDNAVRVALAAEIQASALALDDTGLTFTWREAVVRVSQMVMLKYTQPKEPTNGTID